MNKRLFTFVTVFLIVIVFAIFKHSVEFVYVNPQVNTSVFSHIAKTIFPLDNIIKSAVESCNQQTKGVKLLYINGYGSGFLKGNSIPNDLDYSVGIDLGKFEYDGQNAKEVAKEVNKRINQFQIEFYNSVNGNSLFYSDYSPIKALAVFSGVDYNNVDNMAKSISKVIENKDYVVYTRKQMKKDVVIDFPFILKSNEILIEDTPPITLFSDNVKYNDNSPKFLREITIVPDYFIQLVNTKTGEMKNVEIVAEAFTGQRLQLSRRFFVPIVFTGENSAMYLKNLDYLNNEDEYVYYRLFNYGRHLREIQNLSVMNNNPIKLLKRVAQCMDLIYPALKKEDVDNLSSIISENLSNEGIKDLNTYTTVIDNILKISMSSRIYANASMDGKIQEMLNIMDNSLLDLKRENLVDEIQYKKLDNLNNELKTKLQKAKSVKDMEDLVNWIADKQENLIAPIEVNIFDKTVTHKAELIKYVQLFNSIYEDVGFHKIDLYWLQEGVLGVIKDDFTKDLTKDDLKKLAKQNRLVDIDYVLIDRNDVDNMRVRYSLWVRYNPTKIQEQNWNNLQKTLKADKKNFKIKRRFVF